jgi:hypothetical protein
MSRIRKLTPRLLKKIIQEEKSKLSQAKKSNKRSKLNEASIDNLTKLALQEIRALLEVKRLRRKRKILKNKISKKMR